MIDFSKTLQEILSKFQLGKTHLANLNLWRKTFFFSKEKMQSHWYREFLSDGGGNPAKLTITVPITALIHSVTRNLYLLNQTSSIIFKMQIIFSSS